MEKMNEITQTLQLPSGEVTNSTDAATSTLSATLAPEGATSEETAALPEETSKTTTDTQNIPAQETVQEDTSPLLKAGRFFHNISDAAKNSIQNINQNINQMLLAPQESSDTVTHTPAVIDTLLNNVAEEGQEQNALFTFLTSQERTDLSNALSSLSLPSGLSQKILSGNATAKEVLSAIREAIPTSDSGDIQRLFQTEAFQKLFSQSILENFTITPKQLAKKGEMDSFYENMERQADAFEKLISSTLSGDDSRQLSQESHDMKSNIDFMKTLNETFGYMQLPLKLQNQNTHGDLYVYTKKEKLKQNQDQISILLHLEMEHLGTLNVKLDKENNNIKADFKMDNDEALELVSRNTHLLQNSLNEKGYTCQISVQPLEQPETPVQDFLNTKITTSATKEMKRFSFDIRA
jgi:flagellar hook-length control protein FliK